MAIKDINVETLDEFWELISPIGSMSNEIGMPIYRGQGDSKWHLTPAVFRKDIIAKYGNFKLPYNHTEQVILLEYFLLVDFLHYIDEMGLVVPQDSENFRHLMSFEEFTRRYSENTVGWPAKEYIPFIAMAQHHGVPTRLLDWTRNSLVAAYFSASQVLSCNTVPERMAVWVMDSATPKKSGATLDFISVPGSTSDNLAAQKGVFVLGREQSGVSSNSNFEQKEQIDLVDKILAKGEDINAYKITLPAKFAGELMLRCIKFGQSAASLFPGFDGAAKAALEFKLAKKSAGVL